MIVFEVRDNVEVILQISRYLGWLLIIPIDPLFCSNGGAYAYEMLFKVRRLQ